MGKLNRMPETVHRSRSFQNQILLLYFVVIAVVTLVYGLVHAHTAGDWAVSDWAINYHGGFVRRGITGELALWLSSIIRIPLPWIICVVVLGAYAVLLWTAYRLLQMNAEHSLWTWLLILSPATFGFQILDAGGGFRKEVLLFAGLCVILLLLKRGVNEKVVAGGLCLWLPFLIFAHESLFFYVGYYGAALLLHARRKCETRSRRWLLILVPPLAASGIAMAAACLHPGNAKIAATVCSAARQRGIAQCGPAMKYLGCSATQSRNVVKEARRLYDFPLIYAATGTLALLPLAMLLGNAMRNEKSRWNALLICGCAIGSVLISLPLYLYALDWGRWIYIHVLCMTLLVFAADFDHAAIPLCTRDPLKMQWPIRIFAIAALCLYTVAWTLPHVPGGEPYFGYVQMIFGKRSSQPVMPLPK